MLNSYFPNDVDIQLILEFNNSFGKYHPKKNLKSFLGHAVCTILQYTYFLYLIYTCFYPANATLLQKRIYYIVTIPFYMKETLG